MKHYSFLTENKKGAAASMILAPLIAFSHNPTNTVTKTVKSPGIVQVVKNGSSHLAKISEKRFKTGQATDILKAVEEFIQSNPRLKPYQIDMLRKKALVNEVDYVNFLLKQFSK